MKKKILILTMLFIAITVVNSSATLTIYTNTGEGTTYGSFSCNETYDSVDYGTNQYDINIAAGATVYYNVNVGYYGQHNYNAVNIGGPNGTIYCWAQNPYNTSGQQYYSGNFYWDYDGYLPIAMFAAEYAPSSIYVDVVWVP